MRARPIADAPLAVALALATLAVPCRAARAEEPGPPAGGGSLRVISEPPRLLLGRDLGAELRIAVPADVEELSLSASGGRVEGLRRVPGGFEARFRPPPDRIPQVAIVAALGRGPRGTEHGWIAIPLSGQADVRVHTTPGADITLRIADREFGPRRAGADGVATLPVVVPPGVREAYHGFRPIDLRVPETPLLHAVVDRATVRADRQERIRVFAYVVAPHGAARRGDVPTFEASRGSVTATERQPGYVEATWTLPAGRAGEERLAIRLHAQPASRTVLKVDALAGPPAVVSVAFDEEALAAGAAAGVGITARALDAAGNPVPADLALSSDGGELADVRAAENGTVSARLRMGPSFGGRGEVRVAALARGAGISGARALKLRSADPTALRFGGGGSVVRGDGIHAATLRVSVEDRYGNPVDVSPAVVAERGKVLRVVPAERGGFDVQYVPPLVPSPQRDRLVATAGPLRAAAEPLLLPPAPILEASVDGGVLLDLREGAGRPRTGLVLERPDDWTAIDRDLDLRWRAEVEAMGLRGGGALAILVGGALGWAVHPAAVLHAAATAGALTGAAGSAPAGRISAGLTLPAGTVSPFFEVSLLGARGGGPGSFAAAGFAAGLRLQLGRFHGDDPHRR